jgi:hypothetical protein
MSENIMGSASRYWQLVGIDASGKRKLQTIAIAKAFCRQQLGSLLEQADVSDSQIQHILLNLMYCEGMSSDSAIWNLAGCCLRCFISHQIEQACIQLETKFGAQHGFTRYDLFPFVLDDQIPDEVPDPPLECSVVPYRSLAVDILQTFDPQRARLGTWVFRQVRHHRELNVFLREHGVYLMSDWAILNDTKPEQLQRILSEFYTLTPEEIKHTYYLLEGYHKVYREDRWQQRQAGKLKGKQECLPPTLEQLTRMAHYLQTQLSLSLSNERILGMLKTIASQLRRYRIYSRGGCLPTESLDQPNTHQEVIKIEAPAQDIDLTEQNEFLTFYREQFLSCLDQVLDQVISDRLTYLQRKNPVAAQQFLTALQLFHCQGQSMGKIASQVGLEAQYQVTRLMQLKELRATVRQKMLQALSDRIVDKAKSYATPQRLQELDQQLDVALEEEISRVMHQAEAEAAVAKDRPLRSLFARRLCHYLDSRRTVPC